MNDDASSWCLDVGQEWRHGRRVDAPDENILQNVRFALHTQTSETTNEFAQKTLHHVRGNGTDFLQCARVDCDRERKNVGKFMRMDVSMRSCFIELHQNRKAVCLNIGQSILYGASTWQYDIHSQVRSMSPVSVDVVDSGRTRTTHRKVVHGRISTTGEEIRMCVGNAYRSFQFSLLVDLRRRWRHTDTCLLRSFWFMHTIRTNVHAPQSFLFQFFVRDIISVQYSFMKKQ